MRCLLVRFGITRGKAISGRPTFLRKSPVATPSRVVLLRGGAPGRLRPGALQGMVRLTACYAAAAALAAGAGTDARISELRSASARGRCHAAAELGRAGDKAAGPALAAALSDEDKGVRREAAKALGTLKDERAVPALLTALRDEDANVRAYAAYALGEIQAPQSLGPLLDALGDSNWHVRDQAAWALRELRAEGLAEPLTAKLVEPDADRPHILWLLGQMPADSVLPAISAVLRTGARPDVRLCALKVLAQLDTPDRVPHLIGALADGETEVRTAAVAVLAEAGDERAERPLRRLASEDPDAGVREAAADAVLRLARHPSMIAWWSFDDRRPDTATDSGGKNITGEIRNAVPVEGKVGHALLFRDGAYIELGRPDAAFNMGNRPFTVSAWVKSNAPNGVVIARGGAFCGFSLYLKDSVPKFGIHLVQDGPGYIAAGSKPAVGEWVHLAGVVKERSIELYVNGELSASAETAGFIPGNAGQGLEIGFDVGNSPAEIVDAFDGVIDEVKVFGAALSGEELAKQVAKEQ